MTDTTTVTMYFDATCPFAWVTSRWLKEVGTVRDIEVEWAPMSLAVLNEDNEDISDGYREHLLAAWGPARVAAAVYTEHPEALDAYYTAIGTRIHNEKRGGSGLHGHDGLISEALAEAGLPASLIDVAHRGPDEEGSYEPQLRESHAKALELVGNDVGTPSSASATTRSSAPSSPACRGAETAGTLFDAAVTLGGYPHFFELKRSRTENPDAS